MKLFNHFELELLKAGKVSKHSTEAKGKKYDKGKVYLSDNAFTDQDYELYDVGELSIEEVFSTIKGKGLLIFFPEHKRKKEYPTLCPNCKSAYWDKPKKRRNNFFEPNNSRLRYNAST